MSNDESDECNGNGKHTWVDDKHLQEGVEKCLYCNEVRDKPIEQPVDAFKCISCRDTGWLTDWDKCTFCDAVPEQPVEDELLDKVLEYTKTCDCLQDPTHCEDCYTEAVREAKELITLIRGDNAELIAEIEARKNRTGDYLHSPVLEPTEFLLLRKVLQRLRGEK